MIHKNTKLSIASLILAAIFFTINMYFPFNGVSAYLYLLLIFFSFLAEDSLFTISTLVCVSLIIFIKLINADGIELMNRAFALISVWVVSIISVQRIEAENELKKLNLGIELQVLSRISSSENKAKILEDQIIMLKNIDIERNKEAFLTLDNVINNLKDLTFDEEFDELDIEVDTSDFGE